MSEEKKQSAGRSRAKNENPKNEEPKTAGASTARDDKQTPPRSGTAKKRTAQSRETPGTEPKIEAPKAEPEVKKEPDPSSPANQMLILLLAALAIFIGICFAFRDDVGVIGYAISYVFYGLFGVGALLVPFLLVQLALFRKRDVATGAVRYKYIAAFFALLFFSVMAHTIHCLLADIPKLTITSAFSWDSLKELFQKGLAYRGGGFLGGILASALICATGYPGTIMFGTIFLVIFVMTLFGLTPSECLQRYRFYRSRSQSAREKLRAEQELRREEQTKRAEEKMRRDREQAQKAAESRPQSQPKTKTKTARTSSARKNREDGIDRDIFEDHTAFGTSDEPVRDERVIETEQTPPPRTPDDDDMDVLSRRAGADARAREIPRRETEPVRDESLVGTTYVPMDESADTDIDEEMPSFTSVKKKKKATLPKTEPGPALPAQTKEPAVPLTVTPAAEHAPVTAPDETAQAPVAQAAPVTETPCASDETAQTAPETVREQTPAPERKPIPERKPAPARAIPLAVTPVAEASVSERVEAPEQKSDEISIRPPEMSVPAPSTEDDGEEELIPRRREYEFPPIDLLQEPPTDGRNEDVSAELRENADKIIATLKSFNVSVNISNVSRGPTITRYEVEPSAGTRVRSILNLLDDIALSLATSGVRSDGIITGKSAIGIEVPNKVTNTVFVRALIEDTRFSSAKSKLTCSLGMDVSGAPVYLDIGKMPHLLIAGATGQGKSVCINSLLISLLYKARPDEVKLILIDPKKVELNVYNGLPHLLVPVVFDPKKAAGSLHWAVQEMERRFELIEAQHVRNLAQYNAAVADDPNKEKLPQIVIIIDELADLMMSAPDDVETSICRLAQKARAAGMHLIIGTQRPSTDVITGLIKANIPSRIAFTVSNQIDSRIIIDTQGAEKLIGRGDMLFSPVGSSKPVRVQGAFVSETEIENIIEFIKDQSRECTYSDDVIKEIEKAAASCGQKKKGGSQAAPLDHGDITEEDDPMLDAAIELAVDEGKISTSLIQRRLQLGYGRAAKLIDVMERRGIVSPPDGQRPRKLLISREQYLEMRMNHIDGDAAAGGTEDDAPFDV